MAQETALNSWNHTDHMVEKYIGSAFDDIKLIIPYLDYIKAVANKSPMITCEGREDYGFVSDPVEDHYCMLPIEGITVEGSNGESFFEWFEREIGDQNGDAVIDKTDVKKWLSSDQSILIAQSTGATVKTGVGADTINFGSTRINIDPENYLSFSSGRNLSTLNGIFRVQATVHLIKDTDNVWGAELTATVNNAGNTVIHKDRVELADTFLNSAVLQLDFTMIGNFNGSIGDFENCVFDVSLLGDSTGTMKVVPGSTQITCVRIGDAPDSYVSPISNTSDIDTYDTV